MKKVLYITILACSTLWGSCTEKNKQSARTDSFIEKNVAFARAQIGNEIQIIEKYLQPIITQYFIGNKSEIWSLSLIVHSKG